MVKLVNFAFRTKLSSTDYNELNKPTLKSLAHIESEKSLVELVVPKNELLHFFRFFTLLKSLFFTLSHGFLKRITNVDQGQPTNMVKDADMRYSILKQV